MRQVDRELDRFLTLLRNKIREQGFTQLEVQESLSWGRSYISQLLTKQKSLRVEQVLLILNVIGLDPGEFFAEIYMPRGWSRGLPERHFGPPRDDGAGDELRQELERFRGLLDGLTGLLVEKRILASSDLRAAVEKAAADGD